MRSDGRPSGPQGIAPVRLFFALWPESSAAARLHAVAGEVEALAGGRVMRPETFHMTLAFLGDVSEDRLADVLQAADAVQAARFEMIVDCLRYWPHNRIVWAGSTTPAPCAAALAQNLADRLREKGFTLEKRVFAPHVTLLRKANGVKSLPALNPPIRWKCDEFALVQSLPSAKGADYRTMARWPLRTG